MKYYFLTPYCHDYNNLHNLTGQIVCAPICYPSEIESKQTKLPTTEGKSVKTIQFSVMSEERSIEIYNRDVDLKAFWERKRTHLIKDCLKSSE